MTKDFCSRTRTDKDFSSKDKDCIVKNKDQDKDCILVLKESLRTRTRTNITVTSYSEILVGNCNFFLYPLHWHVGCTVSWMHVRGVFRGGPNRRAHAINSAKA